MLKTFEQGANVTTRQASEINRLHEPRTNCIYGERAFSYCAPKLYNKLPLEIRNLPTWLIKQPRKHTNYKRRT